MPGLNTTRPTVATIAVSGTSSNSIALDCAPLIGISVPPLDTCTLTVSGAVDGKDANGNLVTGPMQAILDETGVQILVFPSTTGNFCLGAKALADLSGLSRIQFVTSAGQNTGARTFAIQRKLED